MLMTRRATLAVFALVIVMWGINWPIMKAALAFIEPLWFGVARFAIGSLALFAVAVLLRRLSWPRLDDIGIIVAVAVFQIALFIGLMHYGIRLVGAGRSALLVYTTPIWVIPLAAVYLREPIHRHSWLGALCGLAGLAVLFNPATVDYHSRPVVIGNLMLLAAAMVSSWPIVYVRKTRSPSDSLSLAAWQLGLGTLLLIGMAVVIEGTPRLAVNTVSIAAILFNGLITSAFCMWGYLLASRELPSTIVALGSLGAPVLGVSASVLFADERFDLYTVAGLALMIVGVIIGTVGSRLLPRSEQICKQP